MPRQPENQKDKQNKNPQTTNSIPQNDPSFGVIEKGKRIHRIKIAVGSMGSTEKKLPSIISTMRETCTSIK